MDEARRREIEKRTQPFFKEDCSGMCTDIFDLIAALRDADRRIDELEALAKRVTEISPGPDPGCNCISCCAHRLLEETPHE